MMIQDIYPSFFDNKYTPLRPPHPQDVLLLFSGNAIYCRSDSEPVLPFFSDIGYTDCHAVPLFAIDGQYFYLALEENISLPGDFEALPLWLLMHRLAHPMNFAAVTGLHLSRWYADNKYCGRCGRETVPGKTERSLVCPDCGNIIYPKISPVVIVAVTNGDQILLTHYADRDYTNYALIAGFCEIGECPEDSVRREVMEETGIRVKNIRYYGSQPWGLSSSMLLGFFADLDGSGEITVDRSELSDAGWFRRDELHLEEDGISLTRDMILHFLRNGAEQAT